MAKAAVATETAASHNASLTGDIEITEDTILSDEDWVAQKDDPQAGADALNAIIDARVAAMRAEIKGEVLAEMAAAQLASESRPSLAMKAKVHDRFFEGRSTNTGTWMKHYRCDAAVSTKVQEVDMDLLEAYESGAKERPVDQNGHPRPLLLLASMPGKTIDWIDGHCYAYTENQVRNIERLKALAEQGLDGGMRGIYEDVGEDQQWLCHVCDPAKTFGSKQTYANHMQAVHGVQTLAA